MRGALRFIGKVMPQPPKAGACLANVAARTLLMKAIVLPGQIGTILTPPTASARLFLARVFKLEFVTTA